MTRAALVLILALVASGAFGQKPAPPPEEPPEEDASLKAPKEYILNPVQAEKEFKIGLYYAKKRSWRAAANRFSEAVKWNPAYPDAYFKLAEVMEKLGDKSRERQAWEKFLEAAPDDKRAPDVQKRLKELRPAGAAGSKK